ncbi:hypothetical protein GWK47_051956 [Chionoecetes opilio]|uniref:Uncharacterized protein n=1 Tax=Chionoecetes opilio TaxID=41210 RepID=A0A8J4Y7K6_CHIOP|nr:hypothetical protein GWK47_051956 [Chionoecetes opilio]
MEVAAAPHQRRYVAHRRPLPSTPSPTHRPDAFPEDHHHPTTFHERVPVSDDIALSASRTGSVSSVCLPERVWTWIRSWGPRDVRGAGWGAPEKHPTPPHPAGGRSPFATRKDACEPHSPALVEEQGHYCFPPLNATLPSGVLSSGAATWTLASGTRETVFQNLQKHSSIHHTGHSCRVSCRVCVSGAPAVYTNVPSTEVDSDNIKP